MRDNPALKRVPGHDALGLMLQCEGDLYWAVQFTDLPDPDPPVHSYFLDYDGPEGTWRELEPAAPSLALLAIQHSLYFMPRAHATALVPFPHDPAWRSELRKAFAGQVRRGWHEYFENPGVLARAPRSCWR